MDVRLVINDKQEYHFLDRDALVRFLQEYYKRQIRSMRNI